MKRASKRYFNYCVDADNYADDGVVGNGELFFV